MADNTVFTFRYEGDNPPQGGNTSGQAQGLPILSPRDFRETLRLNKEVVRAQKILATEQIQQEKRNQKVDAKIRYDAAIREARRNRATPEQIDELKRQRGYEISEIERAADVRRREIIQAHDNTMRLETQYRTEQAKAITDQEKIVMSRIRKAVRQEDAAARKAAQSTELTPEQRQKQWIKDEDYAAKMRRREENEFLNDQESRHNQWIKDEDYAAKERIRDAREFLRDQQERHTQWIRDEDYAARLRRKDADAEARDADRRSTQQDKDQDIFERQRRRDENYSRVAARIFRTYLIREFGGHRAGRINAAGEAAQEAALRIGPTALGRMLAGFGTAAKVVGTGAALANVAVQLARLPERLAAMTRGLSESNGGPSLSRIEMFSPQAALARAAQARISTFGALESSRTIGTAMAARINAETRLAEASRRASDRLYNAATPIYVWAKGAAATAIEAIAGTYNPSKNPRNELIQYGYSKFAKGGGNWWQNEEMLKKLDAFEYGKRIFALEDWAKQARADELRNTASRMGFLPFPEKMIEPIQFEEFRDGWINAKTGMREPPIWVDDSLLGF